MLHRDIKPSNIVVGGEGHDYNAVYLIDFGLARVYLSPAGEVRPPRETAAFRGTGRYASLNAHYNEELVRVEFVLLGEGTALTLALNWLFLIL